jgi:hypothetical protein
MKRWSQVSMSAIGQLWCGSSAARRFSSKARNLIFQSFTPFCADSNSFATFLSEKKMLNKIKENGG